MSDLTLRKIDVPDLGNTYYAPQLDNTLATAFSTSATYAVGDLVVYNRTLYKCTTAVTSAGAWNASNWTSVAMSSEISNLKNDLNNQITPYNPYDILYPLFATYNESRNGATFTWDGHRCTVTGTNTTSISVNNIIPFESALPADIVAGETYPFLYETTNANIQLGFIFYDSSETPTYINKSASGTVTVPSTAQKWALRLYIESGKNPAGTVSKIAILSEELPKDYVDGLIYGTKDPSKNHAAPLTYFNGIVDYNSSNRLTPHDLPSNAYVFCKGDRLSDFPTHDDKYYWIWCFVNYINTNSRLYIVLDYYNHISYYGYSTSGGISVDWGNDKSNIKILCIGSSFGQDCSVYTPFLMEEMNKSINVTFGIIYMSGGSISQYSGWFDDNTSLNYYKRLAHNDSYDNGIQDTFKNILSDEEWDIILINQSAYDGGVLSTYSGLNSYLWKISQYVDYSVKFGYLMPQAAIGYSSRYTYNDLVSCAQNVYNTAMVSFVIPAGTAIENARNTRLDEIGSYSTVSSDGKGHLCADGPNSTPSRPGHLEEGLPVLIANYVTASKLLEESTGCIGKFLGSQIRPTSEWVTSHNIPGQNGTSIGVTEDNVTLGQRCAIQAIKIPYEASIN